MSLAGHSAGGVWRCAPGPTKRADSPEKSASQHRRALCREHLGARSRTSVGPADSRGQLTILDYRAPASFGPPRHLHHREDEVLELIEGQAVVWTPNLSFVLAAGDLVLLPKLGPHTWRAYGPKGIRFTATFTPSGFERFFQDIERRRLLATDVAELRAVAADVGMDILGPPLSDEEVRQIRAGFHSASISARPYSIPLSGSTRTRPQAP